MVPKWWEATRILKGHPTIFKEVMALKTWATIQISSTENLRWIPRLLQKTRPMKVVFLITLDNKTKLRMITVIKLRQVRVSLIRSLTSPTQWRLNTSNPENLFKRRTAVKHSIKLLKHRILKLTLVSKRVTRMFMKVLEWTMMMDSKIWHNHQLQTYLLTPRIQTILGLTQRMYSATSKPNIHQSTCLAPRSIQTPPKSSKTSHQTPIHSTSTNPNRPAKHPH